MNHLIAPLNCGAVFYITLLKACDTMLMDMHTHTAFSVDSEESFDNMFARAQDLGLLAYAVTDHCEAGRFYSAEHYGRPKMQSEFDVYDYRDAFLASVGAVTDAKENYNGSVKLLCGVELGEPLYDIKATCEILSDERLDFVIASLHELEGYDDFAFLDYRNFDVHELLYKYFLEIYRICKWGEFDSLGHLTYTLRYIEGKFGFKPDMSRYTEIIRESLRAVAEKNKALEINTSGLRQNYGKPFPEPEYVRMFREAGGEIITIGSDAHNVRDLAAGISDGIAIAKDAGFRYIAYYEKRKPVFVKI